MAANTIGIKTPKVASVSLYPVIARSTSGWRNTFSNCSRILSDRRCDSQSHILGQHEKVRLPSKPQDLTPGQRVHNLATTGNRGCRAGSKRASAPPTTTGTTGTTTGVFGRWSSTPLGASSPPALGSAGLPPLPHGAHERWRDPVLAVAGGAWRRAPVRRRAYMAQARSSRLQHGARGGPPHVRRPDGA